MWSSLVDGWPRRDRFIGSGGKRADVGLEGVSGHFDALSLEGPTVESHEAILKILLGGDGQTVTWIGTCAQRGIPRADSACVPCEHLSTPPIP